MLLKWKQKKQKTGNDRKRKKGGRFRIFFAVLFIFAISIKIYVDTNSFKVNSVQFHSDKIPGDSSFTILQISDLHNKVFGSNNEELIETVESTNADIIVLTGDLVDRRTDNFDHVFSLVERIKAINQHVYFVSGNHEWDNSFRESLLDGLAERNVTILNNQHTELVIDDVKVNLVGIDNASTNHDNLDRAFDNVDQESYTILLSHTPTIFEKSRPIPADIFLSGHTHGGQVRIPFIGALVAPDQGFFPKLEKGTYEFVVNQFLYIDSGLGTSVAPVRFLNQSQVSLIEISGE
ncbi:metallophosphoesterase [Oceanobacillus sp. CF4.6]|uniref:metallophosphoesterase n=1 Tax=Oceanobacillus sp. CF4.6 TaxID=3373080 RepID=UPI003EE7123D